MKIFLLTAIIGQFIGLGYCRGNSTNWQTVRELSQDEWTAPSSQAKWITIPAQPKLEEQEIPWSPFPWIEPTPTKPKSKYPSAWIKHQSSNGWELEPPKRIKKWKKSRARPTKGRRLQQGKRLQAPIDIAIVYGQITHSKSPTIVKEYHSEEQTVIRPGKKMVQHIQHNEQKTMKIIHHHNRTQKVIHKHNKHQIILNQHQLHKIHLHNTHLQKEHLHQHKVHTLHLHQPIYHLEEKNQVSQTEEHKHKQTVGESHSHIKLATKSFEQLPDIHLDRDLRPPQPDAPKTWTQTKVL